MTDKTQKKKRRIKSKNTSKTQKSSKIAMNLGLEHRKITIINTKKRIININLGVKKA